MEAIRKLSLAVSYEQPPDKALSVFGFLFYCNGLLLQVQPVRNNVLEFDLSKAAALRADKNGIRADELRVFLAPGTDKEVQKIKTIAALEKLQPYEAVLSSTADGGQVSILPVPAAVSRFWPVCQCRVSGKVSKWVHYGNSWEDRPVCRARVHICEIDPIIYWIRRIPDPVIAKIPELFLNPAEVIRNPVPVPDPPPFLQTARNAAVADAAIFNTQSPEQLQLQAAEKLPDIGADLRQQLLSGNLDQIRNTIVNNYALLHPWFCLRPWWWPWLYRCTERKVVYTDASGRFDTSISYRCFGDQPDLYIWVEYLVNGVWTTVYNPPKPCNTYWDYHCGTELSIHITDPRVPVDCCCNCPLPGDLVMIRSIGGTSVTHINQQSYLQAPAGQSVSYNRIGLTDAAAIGDGFFSTSVGDFKRPFGGTFHFYMGFGQGLPRNDIYYYRWSYRKVNAADLNPVSGTTEQIDTPEYKSYDFIFIDGNGDQQIGHDNVKLGPFTVGGENNLYIIPPERPSQAPFNAPQTDPQWYERTHNTHTIGIDSVQLKNGAAPGGDGLYEFKLELFNQSGTLLTNVPKTTFKVPKFDDADTSVNAPDELLAGVTATSADAFKVLVRVDNSVCNSAVFTVNVNGAPAASDCCGFVKYKPEGAEADLELSFLATHPNDFAVFSFGVSKGTCGGVANAGALGMVIDDASGYTLAAGIYRKHFTPVQLLDTCYAGGSGKAAFAETLSVIAMATDGTYRQSGKDAPYRVAAFALEP
ncbi:hypothetical protein LQ567_13545 [Niabella pedocola]|uniref:Uncharacterized protein n=1 Tax=Niabella pedocola TaxID=1752077 RepID=A0ABS8PRU0_9BACT|nr:hypothetical protein [Niabella pedocola]MCD2423794.1 hypothetical protein [Niabella pedocola]